jgi:hypothetical protein
MPTIKIKNLIVSGGENCGDNPSGGKRGGNA